ncbi:MAG: GAF domain-containing protein [Anaerolineae bacterium]
MLNKSRSSSSESQDFANGLSLMSQIGQAIVATLEPGKLIEEIYHQTHKVIPANIFTLSLFTDDPNWIDMFAVDKGQVVQERRRIGTLTRWVVEQRTLFSTPDDQVQLPPVPVTRIETDTVEEPRAYILIPMITHDKVVGVISVQSYEPDAFNDMHLAMLSAIASHSAIVIENNRLLAQAQHRAAELASLERIGYELARLTNIEDVLKKIITEAKDLLTADSMSIFAYDERRGKFRPPAFILRPGAAGPVARERPPREIGLTIRVVRLHCAIFTEVAADGQVLFAETPIGQNVEVAQRKTFEFTDQDTLEFLQAQNVRSSIGFPLSAGRDIVGVLYINYQRPHTFGQDEFQTIGRLAQYAGTAIQRANVYGEIRALHQAGHALTGQTEMRAVLNKLVEYGHEVLGADLITVFPYHAGADEFELPPVVSGVALKPDQLLPPQIKSDDTVRRIVTEKSAHFSRDAQIDPLLAGSDPALRESRFVSREQIVSAAAIPLRTNDDVVGALFFNYRTRQRFGSHQRTLIETFAAYAATAIQRARLLDRRLKELRALAEIDAAITSGSLRDVLDKIIQSACEIVGAKDGNILLLHESGEYLYLAARQGEAWRSGAPERFETGTSSVTGWVAAHKKTARIGNVRTEEPWKDIYLEVIPDIQSELSVPILDEQKQLVGIIFLDSKAAHAFSADDERLLEALAGQAYIAIRNRRQFEAEQRALRELHLLREIDNAVSSTLNTQEVLQLIVDKIDTLIDAPIFVVMLADERRGDLYQAAGRGVVADLKYHRQKIGTGIVGQVALTHQSVRIGDVNALVGEVDYLQVVSDTRSELAVPILQGDQLVGVLNVESPQVNAFNADDERLLNSLASLAVVGIQNSRLYEQEQRSRKVIDILRDVDKAIAFLAVNPPDHPVQSLAEALSPVLQIILNRGLEAVGAVVGSIMLYDEATDDLYMAAEQGVLSEYRNARQKIGQEKGIIGKVALERQILRIDDVTATPWNTQYQEYTPGMRSELAVPLMHQNRLVGVLNAESPRMSAFGPDEENLFETLAGQAVIAYLNAERYQALQTLRDINQLLASGYDTSEVLKLILEYACTFFRVKWGNLRVYDPSGRPTRDYVLVTSALDHAPDIRVIDLRLATHERWLDRGIVDWVAQHRTLFRSQGDVRNDQRFLSFPGLEIRSEMTAPLSVGPDLVGVLNLESERPGAFDEEDENRMGDFSAQAALAVQNARNLAELQETQERFSALYEVGSEIITAPLNEQKILEIALNAGLNRTGVFHAIAWQPDRDGKQLEARLVLGEQQSEPHEPIPRDGTLVNSVAWQKRSEILVDDVTAPPEGVKHRPGYTRTGSMLVMPMMAGGEYFGNLDFRHKDPHGFKQEEIRLLNGLTAQAANAIRRIRHERELDQFRQREHEARAMTDIGMAAGELGHRIGNKLGLFKTHIEAIKEQIGSSYQDITRRLDYMSTNVQYLLTLTQQLKQELNDRTSGVKKQKKDYSAAVVLFEACNSKTPSEFIHVQMDPPTDDLIVRADDSIFDAFINIYSNAIEALELQGGTIYMSACQINGWIEFRIADDGPGIEAGKLDKIFNLFYSTKQNSLGFGLFSAKQRVLANGGQIEVHSKIGEGTTFIIRLPSALAKEVRS